jgi:hypothetical protein
MLGIQKRPLGQSQRLTVEIIEAIRFGLIQGLAIRDGQPCYDPSPRIVQSIKLGSDPEPLRQTGDNDTLKKAIVDLFERLSTLSNCTVDIEVQHGLPFRLIVERSCEEFD